MSRIAACAALAGALSLANAAAQTSPNPDVVAGIQAYNRGDHARAFRLLKAQADAGDSDAQVNLGYMYARGDTVPINHAEALRLYELSAAQNNGEGMNAIGYKYKHGSGVTPDIDKAVYWYCAAIARGSPRALNNLGWLYMDGEGVPKDPAEARALWLQAAERNNVLAMYSLGRSYMTDADGVPQEPEQALLWLTRAARRGHGRAQELLVRLGAEAARMQWPAPIDHVRIMEPEPRNAPPGRAKACGALLS